MLKKSKRLRCMMPLRDVPQESWIEILKEQQSVWNTEVQFGNCIRQSGGGKLSAEVVVR